MTNNNKLKDLLYVKKIKQIDLCKDLGIDAARISLFVNGVIPIPKKHHEAFAKAMGIPLKAFLEAIPNKRNL